jgi:hypothetical protein
MSTLLVVAAAAAFASAPVDAELAKKRAALVAGHDRTLEPLVFVGLEAVPGRLVVDVREARDGKIPGSLALSLHALRTKGYLRGRKVLLVNEGYGYERLVQECQRLRRGGVPEAVVLAGGMAQWAKGERGDARRVERIPPQGYYADKDLTNVLVVAVHGPGGSKKFDLLPGALVLPDRAGVASIVGAVRDVAARRGVLYVVLVAESESVEQGVATALDAALAVPVFRFEGGYDGYRAFLDQQVRIWQGGGRVSVSGCPTCN